MTAAGATALPDRDVLVIDVNANPTLDTLNTSATVTGVGTTLYNIRYDNNRLYIPNTDALNVINQGTFNFTGGQVVNNQISIVDLSNGGVSYVNLDAMAQALTPGVTPTTGFAMPTDIVFHPTRPRAYVACFGSDIVLELDLSGPVPVYGGHVVLPLPAGSSATRNGPRTLEISTKYDLLYAYNHVSTSRSRIDLSAGSINTGATVVTLDLSYDPTAANVKAGRGHLINADLSQNRTSACASCHIDGNTDLLVWELSDSLDAALTQELDIKGPMVTQTLRGLPETAPFHWRGEQQNLGAFNDAFAGLFKGSPLPQSSLADLVAYMQAIKHPPNPRQSADRSYIARNCWDGANQFNQDEAAGLTFFTTGAALAGGASCDACHQMPLGTNGEIQAIPGVYTPPARSLQVTQLRGVGDKMPPVHMAGGPIGNRTDLGSGLTHDGDVESILAFVQNPIFTVNPPDDQNLASFLEAFDTGMAPATGYLKTINPASPQYTVNPYNPSPTTMIADFTAATNYVNTQAGVGNADFMVFFSVQDPNTQLWTPGALFYDVATNTYLAEQAVYPPQTNANLLSYLQNTGQPITFVGMPAGNGYRRAIDYDNDGILNLDEATVAARYVPSFATGGAIPNFTTSQVMYATTNAIKFEFQTDKPCRSVAYLTGDPTKAPLPGVGSSPGVSDFDTNHQLVINNLPALADLVRLGGGTAASINISVDIIDAGGQINTASVPFQTGATVIERVKIKNISLAAYDPVANQATVEVELSMGTILDFPVFPFAAAQFYDVMALAHYSTQAPGGMPVGVTSLNGGATMVATSGFQDKAIFVIPMPASTPTDPVGQRRLDFIVDHAVPASGSSPTAPLYVESESRKKNATSIIF